MSTLPRRLLLSLTLLFGISTVFAAEKKVKIVAGKADVLKHVRKQFAQLLNYDASSSTVQLRIEGEKADTTWPVLPDAEIKIHGWWGRAEQLRPNDRVWVWWMVDREKKPRAILMIADEMSEQDIHGELLAFKSIENDEVTVHVPDEKKVKPRTLRFTENYKGTRMIGQKIFAQTASGVVQASASPSEFEKHRATQQDWLREVWRVQGLPGRVSVLHPISGEMDLVLDHEAIRWGRYLKRGDKVTLLTERRVSAVVKSVQPWRERTQLRLVTNSGLDQLDYTVGQRLSLVVPEPPTEVQASTLPTDLGRLEEKEERVRWFLNSIYCSCGIAGDKCTGMFYIQASCNVNGCGMPKMMAGDIREMIDKDFDDRKIYDKLLEARGPDLWRPHLLR